MINNNNIESFKAIAAKIEAEFNLPADTVSIDQKSTEQTKLTVPYPKNIRFTKNGEVYKKDEKIVEKFKLDVEFSIKSFVVFDHTEEQVHLKKIDFILYTSESLIRYRKYKLAYVFGTERDQELFRREIFFVDVGSVCQTCLDSKPFSKYLIEHFDADVVAKYSKVDVRNDNDFYFLKGMVEYIDQNYDKMVVNFVKNCSNTDLDENDLLNRLLFN